MSGASIPVDFCTLGMFIIDEIHFQPPTPPVTNVLGGAGSYSALGARLFSPPPLSQSVGWVVDCGYDFPPELREVIASWQTGCLFRETPERLTTRGWNGYGEGEHRAFRYTTPKLRLDHKCLNAELLSSKSFHLICSPKRCIELVRNILALRYNLLQEKRADPPLFIWEPVPDLCVPKELQNCLEALKYVDVVSPNHSELGSFFGRTLLQNGTLDKAAVLQCTTSWLDSGVGISGNGAVVIRAGKDGCYVATRKGNRWIPAYHDSAEHVVDPTGGGNAFLGGLAVGLIRVEPVAGLKNIDEAAIWGSVAASFAIEQVGVPMLAEEGIEETWNGVHVHERLDEFRQRLDEYIQP